MKIERDNLTGATDAERHKEQRELDLALIDSKLCYLLMCLLALYAAGISATFLLGRTGSDLEGSASSATVCVMVLMGLVQVARRRVNDSICLFVITLIIWNMAVEPSSLGDVFEFLVVVLEG